MPCTIALTIMFPTRLWAIFQLSVISADSNCSS
jgi:hypothetical protein